MRKLLQATSIIMLLLTVLFPMLFLFDVVSEVSMKWALLLVTIIWFAVTPLWMGREAPTS